MENNNYHCQFEKISHSQIPLFLNDFFKMLDNTCSPHTKLCYARDISTFFYFLQLKHKPDLKTSISTFPIEVLKKVESETIENYLQFLTSYEREGKKYRNSDRSKLRQLRSLNKMFAYLLEKNIIENNPVKEVQKPIIQNSTFSCISKEEIDALLFDILQGVSLSEREKITHEKIRYRDASIFLLILSTGLKVSDVANINENEFDFKKKELTLKRKNVQHTFILSEELCDLLIAYTEKERINLIQSSESAFFLSLSGARISVRTIQERIKKYTDRCENVHRRINPRQCRNSYGLHLYENNKNSKDLGKILGNKDFVKTAAFYQKATEYHN